MGKQSLVSLDRPVVFTVRLPRRLHARFKKACVDLNLDMTAIVRTMIRLFLEDDEFRAKVLDELN